MPFELDPNFEAAFLRSDSVQYVVGAAAYDAAEHVRKATRHKSIRDGIKVAIGISEGRVVARIVATDFKSHWFEFGTVKMRAEPFLSTGVMAAGYHLEAKTR